jgi:hypothetical protein
MQSSDHDFLTKSIRRIFSYILQGIFVILLYILECHVIYLLYCLQKRRSASRDYPP